PHSSWRRNSPCASIAARASATIFARVSASTSGSSRSTRSYVGGGNVTGSAPRRLAGLALRADVGQLLVNPVSGIPGGDDLREPVSASASLAGIHRQRRVDRVRQ